MGQNEKHNHVSLPTKPPLVIIDSSAPYFEQSLYRLNLFLLVFCLVVGTLSFLLLLGSAVQFLYLIGLMTLTSILLVVVFLVSLRFNRLNQKYNALSRESQLLSHTLAEFEYKYSQAQTLEQKIAAESDTLNTITRQNITDVKLETTAITNIISFVQEMTHASHSISAETEQLSLTSAELKSSSGWVKAKATEVMDTGEKGANTIERTIASNREVGKLYNSLSQTLTELAQRQSQIREVVNLIKEISNETHLLSLNATIEAAGAGPYGERFAAIASEVRSLADRVLLSNGEVNQKLSEIEELIKTAASAAETGQKVTDTALELALECGSVIGDLVVSIYQFSEEAEKIERVAENLNSRVNIILSSSTQQSVTSSQAVETLRSIGKMTAQNTRNSEALIKSLENLEELFQGLFHTLK